MEGLIQCERINAEENLCKKLSPEKPLSVLSTFSQSQLLSYCFPCHYWEMLGETTVKEEGKAIKGSDGKEKEDRNEESDEHEAEEESNP